MQALLLRDQPQPASAATGSSAANGAGPGLHVIASAFPWLFRCAWRGSGRFRSPGGRADQSLVCSELGGPGPGTGSERLLHAKQVHRAGKSGSGDRGSRNAVKRPPGQGAVPRSLCHQTRARQGQGPLPFLGPSC